MPTWALAIVGGGVLVAAASFLVAAFAAISRGVMSAPYAWSAPMLAVFSGIGMTQLHTPPSFTGIPPLAFAIGSSLLMLIGGALFQMGGSLVKLCGAGLLVAPLASALLDRRAGSLQTEDHAALLALTLSALAIGLLSLATRSRGRLDNASASQGWQARALRGERELAEARLRAKSAERALGTFAPRNWVRAQLVLGSATLILLAILAGVYTEVYRPLLQRVRAQQVMLAEATTQQETAVSTARAALESELETLRTLLANERTERSALEASERPIQLTTVTSRTDRRQHSLGLPARGADPGVERTPPPKSAKATSRIAKRAARQAARRARLLDVRQAAAEARAARASRNRVAGAENVDDDPIGGLGL
jgi:hypothetical protein